MALDKFELKQDHISLLRNMVFNADENKIVGVFDGDYSEEEMGIIIFGKPESVDLEKDKVVVYSDEQVEYLGKLKEELPDALNIIMQTGSFETGHFKKKHYVKHWTKYEPKN